jgi:Icc-related predicted phosphoesterase
MQRTVAPIFEDLTPQSTVDSNRPGEPGDDSPVRILAICDEVDGRLYGPGLAERRGQYDLLLSCGDLPPYYLDFVASTLSVPIYGVHGNHDASLARARDGEEQVDWGMEELHGRIVHEQGLLIGGLDGCRRYNKGSYQFTEQGMRWQIAQMLPQLLANRLRHGRYLDILVTHAPPRHIHDREDRPHQGFEVFRWFLRTFRPRYHLHGHIHIYDKRTVTRTEYCDTVVLNAYPYRDLMVPAARHAKTAQQVSLAR